jgi:hypothetical protein
MRQIRKAVHDLGTLRETAEGMLSPSFWDSPPIAASLEAAYAGWPKEERFDVPINSAKAEISSKGVALNQMSCSPHKVAVQAIAYRHLFKFLHPDDNCIVLSRRLRFILGTFCADGWFDAVTPLLSQLKCYESVQVLRTWSNSWSTSYRYHESRRLPCLLGCDDMPDCISHYASCPLIHEYVSAVFGPSLSPECLKNFGTSARTLDALRQVACIYYAYHVVKFQPGICIIHNHAHIPCHIPGGDSDSAPITTSPIVINADLARSSFTGGLKAAAFIAGLKCPNSRCPPQMVGC